MKLGIISYHYVPNIGATLQAYALCKRIREFGLECDIVDYRCENITKRETVYKPRKNPLRNLIVRRVIWPETEKRIQGCQAFIEGQKFISNKRYEKNTIVEANSVYDGFISGSDMIWNLNYTDHDFTYFLDFADDSKKLYSYASSIGDKWASDDLPQVLKYLKRYRKIAVREEDTKDFIKNNFKLDCEWVGDPTLLIEQKVWKSMVKRPKESNYVLVYFPYQEILQKAKEYAKRENKRVFVVNPGLHIKGTKSLKIYDPITWMSYFCYADAVFTDSYHGLLFSTYFEKEVWTNRDTNKIQSYLNALGLQYRNIKKDPKLETKIDYSAVNSKIGKLRKSSLEYLEDVISDASQEGKRK